jgi:hypothetical protein
LIGSEEPPVIDLDDDPLGEFGGASAMFEEIEVGTLADLDASGFGLGSSCPQAPVLPSFRGTQISIPAVWCDLGWLSGLTIALALIVAVRILGS